MSRKVAYIGLGSMGADQARLIANSEHELTVFDVSNESRAAFSGLAKVADSVRSAVAQAEIIQICVRDIDQVNDVLFGAGQACEAAQPGALVLLHSTVDVASVHTVEERLQQQGLAFADAPVTRTRQHGDGQFVLTMLGGSSDAFELARPVLDTFSTDVLHTGACGSAMALKIANNMMTWMQLVTGALTFQLASQFNISYKHLSQVTKANGNLTPVTEAFLGGSRSSPEGLSPEHYEFALSQAGIGEKDLTLAIEACQAGAIDTRMMDIARELLRPAMLNQL